MRLRTLSFLLCCSLSASAAQGSDHPLSFEVASVKLADPPSGRRAAFTGGPGTNSPGQLTITNYPLRALLTSAYNKAPWELFLPASLPPDRYDIVAKVPPGTTREQLYVMLQNLLAERFGVVARKEIRQMSVYELVVSKDGPRMTAVENPPASDQPGDASRRVLSMDSLPKDKDGWPVLPPGAIGVFRYLHPNRYQRTMFRAQPVAALADHLRGALGQRPVLDKTGLTGVYSFDLTVQIPESPEGVAYGTSPDAAQARQEMESQGIANALAAVERLGLKAVSTNGPVEVVVIDKVNMKPTEN